MKPIIEFDYEDYSHSKVLIGLSGGINSMAVLCWLSRINDQFKPKELHLFYAHFVEHSPDTLDFVLDGVKFARTQFKAVFYEQTNNSIISFFREQNMIPHPKFSPCTRMLKIIPMAEYATKNEIDVDLVGYVKEEIRRAKRMNSKDVATKDTKHFPIIGFSNEWCFDIVKKYIGWYPKIYDILDDSGNRVFSHNNCLPCKNMQKDDFELVRIHYPEYWNQAMLLSEELQYHWGRDANDFYTTFGREDYEVEYKRQSCEVCAFD